MTLSMSCLMLATMNSELQKQHEAMDAFDMIEHLKLLFQGQARQERFETSRSLFYCKMAEGSPVGPHVLMMIGNIERLERLGFPLGLELATDLILHSLPDSFSQFVMHYNMSDVAKTLPELANMLRTAEQNINKGKGKAIMMVQSGKGKGKKRQASGQKRKDAKKASISSQKPAGGAPKDGTCFHCGKAGHWRRNCPVHLEECKKKGSETSASGII